MPVALPQTPEQVDADLVELMRTCLYDPLKFVRVAYPWKEPGTFLEHDDGPDTWQRKFLISVGEEAKANDFDGIHPVQPLLRAVSKGHGVGGSVMCAWLVDWIMSTRPHAQGTVTANTNTQLETKTWAAIERWTRSSITAHWFGINSRRMYHHRFPKSWFCTPQTCKEQNSEAFAGQHAKDSTSFYIFDEDSAIPEIIHTVAEGGMTDGEPMAFRFGNATRNSGSFYECVFRKGKDRWKPMVIDSRTSRFANQELITQWAELHGEDSDWFRVRVRGLPPRASDLQFIDQERVWAAQKREPVTFDDEPLIAGVDFSGGGQAFNVVRFRRGMDGKSIPPIRVPGEKTRKDRTMFLGVLAELLNERRPEKRIAMMYCDSAYGSPYVVRLNAMGFDNVAEVNFGEPENPDDAHCGNMRAYMYTQGKEWLATGAIPEADNKLEFDLTAPGVHYDKRDRKFIESKEDMAKRGIGPIDDGDAFILTFAGAPAKRKLTPKAKPKPKGRFIGRAQRDTSRTGWTR